MFKKRQIGLDLGSYQTRITTSPMFSIETDLTAVAINPQDELVATGNTVFTQRRDQQADVEIAWPVRGGAVSDDVVLEVFLRTRGAGFQSKLFAAKQSEVFVSTPAGQGQRLLKTRRDVIERVFRGKVAFITDLIAVSTYVNRSPIDDLSLVVNIGDGVTTFGTIRQLQLKSAKCISQAGHWINMNIQRHLYQKCNYKFSLETCRQIKHKCCSFIELTKLSIHDLQIDDVELKVLSQTDINEIPEVVQRALQPVVEEIRWFLRLDVAEKIEHSYLAGGTAQVPGLDRWLAEQLNLHVEIVPEPQSAVIYGMINIMNDS